MDINFEQAQWNLTRMNTKRSTPRHIIIKCQKSNKNRESWNKQEKSDSPCKRELP